MRLRDFQHIILLALPSLRLTTAGVANQPNLVTLSGLGSRLMEPLKTLLNVPGVNSCAQVALQHRLSLVLDPEIIVQSSEANEFIKLVAASRQKASDLLQLINAVLPPEHQTTLSIRIPKITTFDELKDVVDELKVVVERPARLKVPNATVDVVGFDTGTMWLELKLDQEGFILVVSLLAVAARLLLYKRSLQQKATMIADNITPEERAQLQGMTERALPQERRKLSQELDIPKEYANDLELALDRAMKLFERGVQFGYALNAPKATVAQRAKLEQALSQAQTVEQLLGAGAPPRLSDGTPDVPNTSTKV